MWPTWSHPSPKFPTNHVSPDRTCSAGGVGRAKDWSRVASMRGSVLDEGVRAVKQRKHSAFVIFLPSNSDSRSRSGGRSAAHRRVSDSDPTRCVMMVSNEFAPTVGTLLMASRSSPISSRIRSISDGQGPGCGVGNRVLRARRAQTRGRPGVLETFRHSGLAVLPHPKRADGVGNGIPHRRVRGTSSVCSPWRGQRTVALDGWSCRRLRLRNSTYPTYVLRVRQLVRSGNARSGTDRPGGTRRLVGATRQVLVPFGASQVAARDPAGHGVPLRGIDVPHHRRP